MASLALRNKSQSLNLKPHKTLLTFSHFYSSSSSSSNDDNGGNLPPKPPSFSSYFNQQPRQSPTGSESASHDAIRKNLSEFRRRTSSGVPFSANLNPQKPISSPNQFNNGVGNPNPSLAKGGALSFDRIRESLRNMRGNGANGAVLGKNVNNLSLNNLTESFKTTPFSGKFVSNNDNSSNFNKNRNVSRIREFGGSVENLPGGTFGKEIKEGRENDLFKFDLIRPYEHAELGHKLKGLRPDLSTLEKKKKKSKEGEKDGWFSLSELQERLRKLRVIEMEQSNANLGDGTFGALRQSITEMYRKGEETKKPRFDLSPVSLKPSPPKEHLVEKYFHPDNMSAAEKLKLELKKVRDEFKMSESDCGSTRVQIAQLTTEILHLSSVLHKKDKHSRRGLQAKVQQRKKLLKYLRRTDWDSYCFVLSKLGLRDNPDYKN